MSRHLNMCLKLELGWTMALFFASLVVLPQLRCGHPSNSVTTNVTKTLLARDSANGLLLFYETEQMLAPEDTVVSVKGPGCKQFSLASLPLYLIWLSENGDLVKFDLKTKDPSVPIATLDYGSIAFSACDTTYTSIRLMKMNGHKIAAVSLIAETAVMGIDEYPDIIHHLFLVDLSNRKVLLSIPLLDPFSFRLESYSSNSQSIGFKEKGDTVEIVYLEKSTLIKEQMTFDGDSLQVVSHDTSRSNDSVSSYDYSELSATRHYFHSKNSQIKEELSMLSTLDFSAEKLSYVFQSKNILILPFQNAYWKPIVAMDTMILDFLFSIQGQHAEVFEDLDSDIPYPSPLRIGFGVPMTSHWTGGESLQPITSEVAALHMICALAQDDYFFASSRECYFLADSTYARQSWRHASEVINSPQVVSAAWQHLRKWRAANRGKTLRQIQAERQNPMEGSGIIWMGQPGCALDPGYPVEIEARLTRKRFLLFPKGEE